MKGSVDIVVEKEKLEKLIPSAVKHYNATLRLDKNEAVKVYFEQIEDVEVRTLELDDESIGLELDTPFGTVNVWLIPDRHFLAGCTQAAIERAERAVEVLNTGRVE